MSDTTPPGDPGSPHTPAWPSPRRPPGATPPPPPRPGPPPGAPAGPPVEPPTVVTPTGPAAVPGGPVAPGVAPPPPPPPPPPAGGGAPPPAYGAPPPPPGYGGPPQYATAPPPAGPGAEPRRSRKGLLAVALVAVGAVAAAGVGFLVVQATTGDGGGGADDPEAAVVSLAEAFEAEDPVAALAVMNPDEVDAVGDLYESAASRAEALGFAPEAKTLAGIEVALTSTTYEVDEVGDGLARVTIAGKADIDLTRSSLGDRTASVVEQAGRSDDDEDGYESGRTTITADDLTIEGDDATVEPFVMVVERDGGWYVSPLYTAAQYVVDSQGLSDPDVPSPEAGTGADSPEDAVRDLLEAAGSLDGAATGDLLDGEGGAAVRTYRGALERWVTDAAGEDTSAEVETLETEVSEREDGGSRVVVSSLEGTVTWTEDGEEQVRTVSWDGECLDVSDESDMDDEESSDPAFCLTGAWRGVGVEELAVVVAEDDGWRVDPLATVTDYARAMLPELSEEMVLRGVGYPEVAEPVGAATIGEPTSVELNDAGFAVLTLEVEAGRPFTVSADSSEDAAGDGGEDLNAFLVSPEGDYESAFSLVEPTESGEYLLVVGSDAWAASSVEVNVSAVTREPLTLGVNTAGGLSRPGDVVEYEVDLESDQAYEVTFTSTTLDLMALDPDGFEVDLAEATETTSTFDAEATGTYRLRVDGGFEEATGSFRIGIAEVADFVLGNGSSPDATGEVATPGATQFIDLVVLAGREVVVDVVPDAATLDPVFIVLDPATDEELERFDEAGPGGLESVLFTPDETTTYRIQVAGSAGTTGSFTIEARLDE